ncbi:hypothetical protein [Vibrio hangzhouensis]|uniref:Uncharacterized protein n=1 Tax=Vibrio hangzhouensis TaxID=462991 RepID=A0A1H5YC46_9VIBR|nr:hypothetical protein [Vibrio hangzhouensis]SEG21611.1 hypothetical protein SAMN04488244_10911 [Vibrio hangzhouensis]
MNNEHEANQDIEAANDAEFQTGLDDLAQLDNELSGEPLEPSEPEQSGMDSAAVVGMTEMGLFMSEQYISSAAGVEFAFDETAKQKFLEATAPLVEKYGLTWLGWFDAYKEEILFGLATFGLGYSGFTTIKRLQSEKAANDAALKQGGKDGEEAKAA